MKYPNQIIFLDYSTFDNSKNNIEWLLNLKKLQIMNDDYIYFESELNYNFNFSDHNRLGFYVENKLSKKMLDLIVQLIDFFIYTRKEYYRIPIMKIYREKIINKIDMIDNNIN